MKRLILAIMLVASLSACNTSRHVVRETYPIPTPYVPAPPKVDRPAIEIDTLSLENIGQLTDAEKGKIIKAYVASAEAWRYYALALEKIVAEYAQMAKDVEPVRELILKQIATINSQAAKDLETATNHVKP